MANIYEFYRESTVLITGGTGFMGKVLVEKLLRCFEVKKIYLLVRTKKGENAKIRLEKFAKETVRVDKVIFSTGVRWNFEFEHFFQIFDRLREKQPQVLTQKLFSINVNYDADDLDLAQADLSTIADEVDVVFHAMASVKFNETMKNAINVNVLGTKRVLDLVKQIRNLKAFVHVSTCFTQCHKEHLEEKIDASPINCQQLLEMTANLSTELVEGLKDGLMNGMPNTYTLTKRYAEELVAKDVGGKLPVGIFRPPILVGTYEEPFPGWIDNVYGPLSLYLACEKGYIHCVKLDGSKKSNIFPVDYCINALVAVAWDVSVQGFQGQSEAAIPVYNYLYNENNCTWNDLSDHFQSMPRTYPLEGPIWHGFYYGCQNEFAYMFLFYLFHFIPGFVLDCLLVLAGKKRK
jgi:alcohol-forming fatty acyl-CoA reductase